MLRLVNSDDDDCRHGDSIVVPVVVIAVNLGGEATKAILLILLLETCVGIDEKAANADPGRIKSNSRRFCGK